MNISQDFKTILKDKYLDYCQANLSCIKEIKETNHKEKTPDSGFRPTAMFILGAVSAIAPEVSFLIPLFIKMNNDANHIVNVLGLNFDPEIELEKRAEERAKIQEAQVVPILPSSDPYLDEIRREFNQQKEKENSTQ